MNKIIPLALLVGGIVLIIIGFNATHSLSSDWRRCGALRNTLEPVAATRRRGSDRWRSDARQWGKPHGKAEP